MLPVAAVLVDFDGTACSHDVAEHLLGEFGDPSWPQYDDAVDRGEIGLREAIRIQDGMLRATREELLDFALDHCPIEPTFPAFVEWLSSSGTAVAVVSDGFGFYIEPIMRAAGLAGVEVITNEQLWEKGRPAGVRFLNGHPECVGCGTCKMLAVQHFQAKHGSVAFVGEGQSDRYGALYADITFAKDALVEHCLRDGVPFVPWEDFEDVRRTLEATTELPGPVAPARCPGWTT